MILFHILRQKYFVCKFIYYSNSRANSALRSLSPPDLLFTRFKKVLHQYFVWVTYQGLKFRAFRVPNILKPHLTPSSDNSFSNTLL